MKSFESLHIQLTTDEDSVITTEDHDELLTFIQDEWEPSGQYESHLFEESHDG